MTVFAGADIGVCNRGNCVGSFGRRAFQQPLCVFFTNNYEESVYICKELLNTITMEIENINRDNLESVSDVEEQFIISVDKFILLSFITFGLYEIWWIYKAWRFFNQKEKLNISPAIRAILNLFFFYSLLNKVLEYAKENDYGDKYSSILLFLGYATVSFAGLLPEPFWICSSLAVIFLIPPFKALNYAKQNSSGFIVTKQTSFNVRQIVLVVIGALIWGCIVLALFVPS